MKAVQSAITSISFPSTLDSVWDMVDKHGDWITDLDALIEAAVNGEGGNWTAPRWVTADDILFFYHTKSAQRSIAKLLKEVSETLASNSWAKRFLNRDMKKMHSLLERSAERAGKYSGTILGCAQISGRTEYFEKEAGETPHFEGRLFAPIRNIHIFKNPLSTDEFARYVKIGQGATTSLHGGQFYRIRELLERQNELPKFLSDVRIGGRTFRDVDGNNWPLISCSGDIRFIDEAQIRAFLLDFLLKEAKDKGTPLLEECNCYRNRRKGRAKIADYFVKVHERWVPVEAKVNVLAERNLLGQVAEYVAIDYFVPTRGKQKGQTFRTGRFGLCVVADESGLYLVSNGEFKGCPPGTPVWRREELDHSLIPAIRDRIMEEGGRR